MNNKLTLPCILIIFSLLVGCSKKKIDTNEIDISNSKENQNSKKFDNAIFIEVEFEYKIKPNETKKGILKIKEIPQLETLNDKMEGRFLINSDEYSFIFK